MKTINPQILSSIIKFIKNRPLFDFDEVGIKRHRQFLEKSAGMFKPDKSVNFSRLHIDTIQAAWLSPKNFTDNRVVLYIHGGGFHAGSINTHRDLAGRIAKACDARVLIMNYRLAPEHQFPSGLQDIIKCYKWLLAQNILPGSIGVAGDSAGGGLALSLLLMLKNNGLPLPSAAVLISPWVDLSPKHDTEEYDLDKDPMLSQDLLTAAGKLYTSPENFNDPLVSPLKGDLTGLCPLLIQVGSLEILQEDAVRLAKKAKASGTKVTLETWEDMFHVWHYFSKYLTQGREALETIGKFLKNHLQP